MGAYVWHAVRCTELVTGSIGALHAPRTLWLRMEHLPLAERLLPVPVTAMVQTTCTTTITSTVAIPAGLVYSRQHTPYTGLQAPPPGAYMVHPVRETAGYWYPTSSTLIDPMEVCPEAWVGHGGQRANNGECRYVAGGNGYADAGAHFESSVCSGPSAGFEELGVASGAPVGVVGRPESDGHRGTRHTRGTHVYRPLYTGLYTYR